MPKKNKSDRNPAPGKSGPKKEARKAARKIKNPRQRAKEVERLRTGKNQKKIDKRLKFKGSKKD